MKNLSIEELEKNFKELDYEKLVKALFLFEKSDSMEELSLEQKLVVLDKAYQFCMDNDTIASFLQEDIGQILDEAIDEELSKKTRKIIRR